MPFVASKRKRRSKTAGLPHGFLSYEPAGKWKLNCFPDEDCLMDVLGHNGKKLLEWKSDDRIIDSAGRVHRLVNNAEKNCYDLEPTGETWTCQQLLDLAESDARLLKLDPTPMSRKVNDASPDKKMAVLMQCIDERSANSLAARLAMAGFFLFLLAFFLVVAFIAGKFFLWLRK
jgi:hypothetical protein